MDFAWRGLILGTVGGESFVPSVFSASVPMVREVQCHYLHSCCFAFVKES